MPPSLSVKQTAKITFAYPKHRTLQSITYPPEKKSVMEQAAFWHEVKVGSVLALKANLFPHDASVEIAVTFSLRKIRDIPSRSNSKRLVSTAELINRSCVRHF